jgi:accessory gene regulator B
MKYLDVRYYAFGLANLIYKNKEGMTHNERYLRFYGLYLFFTTIVQTSILLLVSLLLGVTLEMIAAMFSFIILRRYAGGRHSKTMWSCTFNSLMLMLISIFIGKLINLYIEIILLIINIVLLLLYAPKDNKNRPISEEKRRKRDKRYSLIIAGAIIVIAMLIPSLTGVIITSLTLECFSLIDLKAQSAAA